MPMMFKHKIANESSKYATAMREVAYLAKIPIRTDTDRDRAHSAIRLLKGQLKYARSRSIQIALDNLMLRMSVEKEIRSMTRQARDQFIGALRRNQGAVLRLAGAREVNTAMVFELSNGGRQIMELMFALLKESQDDKKGSKELQKSAAGAFLAEKIAACESKIKELETAKADAEQQFIAALIVGVVQIAEGVPLPAGSGPPLYQPQDQQSGKSAFDQRLEKAAQSLDSCLANCPPGRFGDRCRSICHATYLADAATCLVIAPR